MFILNERYTMAQLVEIIGTDKQKKHFEKYKTFKSAPMKKALLKELETMVKYELIKGRPQYYLIIEIYEEQQEKYDGRKENSILYPNAKEILAYNLFKNNDFKEDLYFNKTQIMFMAGFARKGFEFILHNRKDYAKKIGVSPKVFSSAVDSKYSYTRGKVDTALNQLKRDRIIENWKDIIYVYGAKKPYIDEKGISRIIENTNYELDSKQEKLLRDIREEVSKEEGFTNYFMAMRSNKNKKIKKITIEKFNEKTNLDIKNFRSKVSIIRLDEQLLKQNKPKTYNKLLNEQVMELCKKEMEETYKELKKKGIDINDIILSEEKKEKISNDVKTSVEYLNIVEIV